MPTLQKPAKIARILQSKGGNLVIEPEGFIVKSKAGPLAKGELTRVSSWAKKLEQTSR